MDGLEGVRQRAAASGQPDPSDGDDKRPRRNERGSG